MMIVQQQASSRPDRTVFLAILGAALIPHIPTPVLHVLPLSIRPTPSRNGMGEHPTPGRPGG